MSEALNTMKEQSIDEGWERICGLQDLPFDAGVAALIKENSPEEQQIALFRIADSDRVYALSNHDPFSDANVLARGILCSIDEKLAVASPVMKEHFFLDNGQCLEAPEICIATYPVMLQGDEVYVRTTPDAGE